MSTALAVATPQAVSVFETFTTEQLELIKAQVAQGCTDDELKYFLYVARARGLDPLARQIYAIRRKSSVKQGNQWVDTWKMTIQTGIDGFRSLAERTGTYAPGEETWVAGEDGFPVSATVSVRKCVGGKWIRFSATAHMAEYAQWAGPKNERRLTDMWARMPHVMLAKCAEAKVLRKGWPEQLAGLYVNEEMMQADAAPDRLDVLPAEKIIPADIALLHLKKPAPTEAPIPDVITHLPAGVVKNIKALQPIADIAISEMTVDDLELLVTQCREWKPRVSNDYARRWLTAIEATAQPRLMELLGLVSE